MLLAVVSCTPKRAALPDYTGIDVRQVIAERGIIESVETTFSVEFERDESTITGDAALKLTDNTLELRIYSFGLLVAEVAESEGVIKSSPEMSRNKSIILVDGLRNSILWWRIKNYDVERQNKTYRLTNSYQEILIDKETMLPVSQTIEIDDGRQLRITYEEPMSKGKFWYPSKMKIELSRYIVRLQIKNINFIHHSGQGQQQQTL